MTQNHTNAIFRQVLLLGVFFVHFGLLAQIETYIVPMDITPPITPENCCFTVEDEKFRSPTERDKVDQNINVNGKVIFAVNEESFELPPSGIQTYTVYFTVTQYRDWDNTSEDTTSNHSLQLIYNPDAGTVTASQVSMSFPGAHQLDVVVDNVDASPLTQYPSLRLTGEIIVERTYHFDCEEAPIFQREGSTTAPLYYRNDIQTMNAAWSLVDGATEYDLEWTFYDLESKFGQEIVNGSSNTHFIDELFANNATRITTSGTTHGFPTMYPAGYLFFRIRAVKVHPDGHREYGAWSTPETQVSLTNYADKVQVDWFESGLNWQASTVFAEEGKFKPALNVFDGSLRQRQSITHLGDEKLIIQTLYDHYGRPSLQTLPAPSTGFTSSMQSELSFFRSIDDPILSMPYGADKNDYWIEAPDDTPEVVSELSGLGRYYGDELQSNPLFTLEGTRNYVPDAEGYPFSITKYTPDLTGRVQRQSGVGATFVMGSGRETKYYYGKPSQEHLDRLFGNDAGNSSHYQKNMVMDPNGQVSISYIDAHGRTVATALAGDHPTNTQNLDETDYEGEEAQLINFDLLNNISGSLTSTYSLMVSDLGDYTFSYDAGGANYDPACGLTNVSCYGCVYDVEIVVMDNDCNAFNDGEPYVIEASNYTFDGAYGLSCNSIGLDEDFVINLPVGSYEITKTLTLSQGAIDYYEEHYQAYIEGLQYDAGANQPDCIPFYEEILAGYPIPTDCNPTTANCLTELGSEADYLTSFALDIGLANSSLLSAEQQALAVAEYSDLVDACNALEGPSTCEIYEEILKSDLRPTELPDPMPVDENGCLLGGLNGQYALYSIVNGEVESDNEASIFYSADGGVTYPYESINFGDIVVVIDGVSYSPVDLSPTDFVTHFHDSWLSAMISTHPEYCYYTACLDEGNDDFDLALRETNSYTDALTFLGVSQTPLPPFSIDFVLAADPFFIGSPTCEADMRNLLDNFDTEDANPGLVDWISRTIYGYGIGNCTTYFGQGTAGENNRAWQLFRGIYLGFKEQIRLEKLTTSGCSLVLPNCNGVGGCPCPIVRRFPDPNEDYSISLEEALALATAAEQEFVEAAGDEGCAGMRAVWRFELLSSCDGYEDLAPAAFQALLDDLEPILDELEAICRLGTDAAHPQGASGTYFLPDGTRAQSPGGYSTFQEVLESMQPSSFTCGTWHPFMISAPGPYERSPYYGASAIISKANTCACEQLKKLEACYENDDEGYASFAEYLTRYGGHQLNAEELQMLQAACEDGPTADPSRYLPEPIQLPQYLTCEGCLGCEEMQVLYNAAKEAYDQLNSGNLNFNDFLAEYINYQLGYSLDAVAYGSFYKDCGQRELTCSEAILLCPETPSDPEFDLDDLEDCIEAAVTYAQQQAQLQYEAQLAALVADFVESYIEYCTDPVNVAEQFTANGTVREYHHTLYYYDQAGNLAKTVPPKGVEPETDLSGVAAYRAGTSSVAVYPAHEMITHYQYNSLQELIAKQMPDCEPEYYWYDEIGRLVLSQDGRQRDLAGDIYYSYTLYDELGRVREVGELSVDASFITGLDTDGDHKVLYCDYDDAMIANSGSRRYITSTYYDEAEFTIAAFGPNGQENLRPRVASITFLESLGGAEAYDYATHYSYDIAGNVKTLVQELRPLANTGHEFKRIDYDYDFLSGNVNAVYYQRGLADQFTYRYLYDEHNRLTDVYTSAVNTTEPLDDPLWEREAVYDYYPHGPLARTQLGQRNVQGCDFAYTLQGWIKGVNSSALEADRDMGRDGTTTNLPGSTDPSPNTWVARDAFSYTLGYFENDYQALGGEEARFEATVVGTAFAETNSSLYNGNIRHMVSQSMGLDGGASGNRYRYDQLHRILEMSTYELQTDAATFSWGSSLADRGYGSTYTYDPNGNLKTLDRWNGNGQPFDQLIYYYGDFSLSDPTPSSNRLRTVRDLVGGSEGVQGQSITNGNNYGYDGSGNLTEDIQAGAELMWNPYGKVEQIDFANAEDGLPNRITLFDYGPDQNRVRKTYLDIGANEVVVTTYYIRDAQGNCLAVYEQDAGGAISWEEQHLYGSSRLGMWRPEVELDLSTLPNTPYFVDQPLNIGEKTYELSNHLGNVTAAISDRPTPVDNGMGMVDHYLPFVRSANEYYPFGMDMAGRSLNFGNYRFGFNGKEADTESEWGSLTHYDYGFRIYNPGIARFLSVDPLAPDYPWFTPYQFAGNRPIKAIDIDGLEGNWWPTNEEFDDGVINGRIPQEGEEGAELAPSSTGLMDGLRAANGWWNRNVTTRINGAKTWIAENVFEPIFPEDNSAQPYHTNQSINYAYSNGDENVFLQGLSLEAQTVYNQTPEILAEFTVEAILEGAGSAMARVGKVSRFYKVPCGCFTAGTIVKTKDGEKSIDEVQVGDWVWAYDELTGKTALKQVLAIHQYDREAIYKITVNGEIIEATGDHPFFVNGIFVEAKDLTKGDSVRVFGNKSLIIDSITIDDGSFKVYNFTVEGFHTYFVGRSALLVHNDPCNTLLRNSEVGETFSGVIDASSGKINIRKSWDPAVRGKWDDALLREGWVKRQGGHLVVADEIGAFDNGQGLGFALRKVNDNEVAIISWKSGLSQTSRFRNKYAAQTFSGEIIDAIKREYGVENVSIRLEVR